MSFALGPTGLESVGMCDCCPVMDAICVGTNWVGSMDAICVGTNWVGVSRMPSVLEAVGLPGTVSVPIADASSIKALGNAPGTVSASL